MRIFRRKFLYNDEAFHLRVQGLQQILRGLLKIRWNGTGTEDSQAFCLFPELTCFALLFLL